MPILFLIMLCVPKKVGVGGDIKLYHKHWGHKMPEFNLGNEESRGSISVLGTDK
jgi:hypothetical protein